MVSQVWTVRDGVVAPSHTITSPVPAVMDPDLNQRVPCFMLAIDFNKATNIVAGGGLDGRFVQS